MKWLSTIGAVLCAVCLAGLLASTDRHQVLEGRAIQGIVIEHGSNPRLPDLWLRAENLVRLDEYRIQDEAGMPRGRPVIRPRSPLFTRIRTTDGEDWFVAGHLGTIGEPLSQFSAWQWPAHGWQTDG